MGEPRTRRPLAAPVPRLGRTGTLIDGNSRGHDRDRRVDEEALREQESHLRAAVAEKWKEGSEARQALRKVEHESLYKDKLLQELLASARTGTGVPGEVFDQIREDMRALLQLKRRSQEARQQLDEKSKKIAAIQQELRASSVHDMEEDVAAAKIEATAKAKAWAEANSGEQETHCFVTSKQHQCRAARLIQQTAETETSTSKAQRRLTLARDERNRLKQTVVEYNDQISKLQTKCSEIEAQREKCEQQLENLGGVEACLQDVRRDRDACFMKVHLLQEKEAARMLRSTDGTDEGDARSKPSWSIDQRLLVPGFQPLCGGDRATALEFIWHLRRACDSSRQTLVEALSAYDSDVDGKLTVAELVHAFNDLRIPGSDIQLVQKLVHGLHDGLASPGQTAIAIVDFVVAVPLQELSESPTDTELTIAIDAMVWACRRRSIKEITVRQNIASWLAEPATGLQSSAESFFSQVGMSSTLCTKIGRGLHKHRENFALLLPSWRCLPHKGRASLLVRFVREIATYRNMFIPSLASTDGMTVRAFIETVMKLGPHWSEEDFQNIAVLAEAVGKSTGNDTNCIPVVDGGRLARAAAPGGFATEFAEFVKECTTDALAACEAAAVAPSRRNLPNVGMSHPQSPPPGNQIMLPRSPAEEASASHVDCPQTPGMAKEESTGESPGRSASKASSPDAGKAEESKSMVQTSSKASKVDEEEGVAEEEEASYSEEEFDDDFDDDEEEDDDDDGDDASENGSDV